MNSNTKLVTAAGFLFLMAIISGGFVEVFVRKELTGYGNAIAAAQNILAAKQKYCFGYDADLGCLICGAFPAVILCIVFNPVNKSISLPGLILGSGVGAVMAAILVDQFAPLRLLYNTSYLKTFSIEPWQAIWLFFLNLQSHVYNISIFLFGFYVSIISHFIYESYFVPENSGVICVFAGIGYFISGLAWFLFAYGASLLSPYFQLSAIIREASKSLWRIIKRVMDPDIDLKMICLT